MSMFLGRTFTKNSYVPSMERQLPNISATSIRGYMTIARQAKLAAVDVLSTAASFCSDSHRIDLCTIYKWPVELLLTVKTLFHIFT